MPPLGKICPQRGEAMKLTGAAVRKAKPEAKSYKKADGGGMYLEVMPNGSSIALQARKYGGPWAYIPTPR